MIIRQGGEERAAGPGALILGAGQGTRAGPGNKLLAADATGTSMIGRTASLVASRFPAGRRVLVLGHAAERVAAAARASVPDLATVLAPEHAEGMAGSLRRGVAWAMAAGWPAALVFLGDMPLLRADTVGTVLDAFAAAAEAPDVVFPVWDGRRGHPVLWHRRRFPALLALRGDRGGRSMLEDPDCRSLAVAHEDPGAFADFDTPERLAAFRRHTASPD